MDVKSLFNRKAQGLPLNTIVIAILVIIVLLVIIVFFTSSFGDSQGTVNEVTGCSEANAAISLTYENFAIEQDACTSPRVRVIGVPNGEDSDGNPLICCGTKK